jgi:cation diffusion facilitator family transporter
VSRLFAPVPIHFNEAIAIATVGLLVNVASVLLLSGAGHDHGHAHTAHDHDHDHDHYHAHDHDHADDKAHRDHNMRAAVVHVLADATVSVLVIVGLILARAFGWTFMDPLVGIVGAVVIATWSYTLIRDTGAILLDMRPDRAMTERVRAAVENDGDRLTDLHLWRLGPGHLGAILSVSTTKPRDADYYRRLLGAFDHLSHVTVEVQRG